MLMWCSRRNGESAHRRSNGRRNGQSLRYLSRNAGARKGTAVSRKVRTGIKTAAVTMRTVKIRAAFGKAESRSLISGRLASAPT
jgi:hypothetical protein